MNYSYLEFVQLFSKYFQNLILRPSLILTKKLCSNENELIKKIIYI